MLAAWPRALVLDYGLPQPLALADVSVTGLLVIALCASSALCLCVLAPPDWLLRLTQFIQPLLTLLPR